MYGCRAILVGPWDDDMIELFAEHGVVELELNHAKGWHPRELSFLTEIVNLCSLTIISPHIPSIAPIHVLRDLLSLDVITYCKTEIQFAAFPRLEECALQWRPKATSLFSCTTLRKLFVDGYKGANANSFANLINLESLAILNSPIADIQGLRALVKLSSLRLANLRQLASLAGIEQLTDLRELDINTCRRITSIDEVSHLSRLRRLTLDNCGDIASLGPVASLRELEWMFFCESTNILDGDLRPLTNQANLSRVVFRNRRHYSHRRDEFRCE